MLREPCYTPRSGLYSFALAFSISHKNAISNGGRLPFLLAILVNSDFKKPNSACDACVMDNMVRFVIEYS